MFFQHKFLQASTIVFLAFHLASPLIAQPIIAGLNKTKISPELQGRVLIEELNCAACHQSNAAFAGLSKKAPRLSSIGSRANHSFLKAFIKDPHSVKPGTTMPDMLKGMGEKQKEATAEALTHFLVSLSNPRGNRFTPKVPDHVAAANGEKLFHQRGCVTCHSPRDAAGNETLVKNSAPLGDLAKKYSHHSLVRFLHNPHAVRPSGRMPKLNIPHHEINNIAEYLLRDTKLPGDLKYTLYRGTVADGIQSDGIKPLKGGHIKDFTLKHLGKLHGKYAVKYEGWLNVTTPGKHIFYMTMNGGSLNINGKDIINIKPSQMRAVNRHENTVSLKAGWNKLSMVYYHVGRRPSLSLEMAGPKFSRGPIPSRLLSVSDKPVPILKPLVVNADLVATGRKHFSALGCASCHDDLNVKSTNQISFAKLTGSKGCLSKPKKLATSKVVHPHYGLSDAQRMLIAKALKPTKTKKLTTIQNIHKSLTTFNCTACHQRDGVGDISSERLNYQPSIFTGTHPELGDQGKIPPSLSHIGAKLKPDWIHKVLVNGKRQRPYMNVVMPDYGTKNIAHLAHLFEKVDALEKVKFPKIDSMKESKNAGYDMIGPKGFSCVACHNYNGQNSVGAGALDLVNVNKSLKKNWFHLFMQNPSRFHTTGIMPNFWPGGKSIRPDVLNGKPDQQIEALWAYLSDGSRAKKPKGLSRQSKDVRVFDQAEIVRGRKLGRAPGDKNQMGYRGTAVGYPERINLDFDGDEMALRTLWKGSFASINFGSYRISGKDRISFPQGTPFHRLKSMDANWPYKSKKNYLFPQNEGYQFRGYSLDKNRRPTFKYNYGDIKVEDFFEDILTASKVAVFKRTFTFNTPSAQKLFYFRAGVGQKITAQSAKNYQVDKLQIRITSDHKGMIRQGSPGDLLIPIKLPKGKSTLTLEYQW